MSRKPGLAGISVASGLFLLLVSCRTTSHKKVQPPIAPPAAEQQPSVPVRDAAALWFKPETTVSVTVNKESKKELFRMMQSSCRSPAGGASPFLARVELDLETPFGVRPVRFTVTRYGMKVLVRGYIGGESTEFIAGSGFPDSWMNGACNTLAVDSNAVLVTSPEVTESLADWLHGFAPDCHARVHPDPTRQGWVCEPGAPSTETAKNSLEETRDVMISGWNRQPYLLARRVAIGLNLLRALRDIPPGADPRPGLKNTCDVIGQSLRAELPLVLTDPRVVDSFCSQAVDAAVARKMTEIVIGKIAAEAETLKQVFENTSKSGALTVDMELPDETAGATLLVTLKPEDDVVMGLARYTQAMLIERQILRESQRARRASADIIDQIVASSEEAVSDVVDMSREPGSILGYACWHPLFDGNHQRLLIAQELGLVTGPGQAPCRGREGPGSSSAVDVTWTPQNYVAESITSDTEFLVGNGDTKALRLPAGTYSYSVQVLPEPGSAIDDSAMPAPPIAEGKVEWVSPRPRPIITDSSAG